MKLLYAPQSPFARKVRVAAIELGLEDRIELEYAELVPGKANASFAAAHNPLRKVPALVTEEGETLFDSTVICDYLGSLADGCLVPSAPRERRRVLRDHALAHGMCEAVILIRYETWLRPEALRWGAWIDDQWDKFDAGLNWFESHLDASAETVDLARITLGCALGYVDFRWPDRGWRATRPRIASWFARLSARASFEATKPASPPESG